MKLPLAALALLLAAAAAPADTFVDEIRPLLEEHCLACHGPDVQQSNVRLDTLSADLVHERRDLEIWSSVLNKLRRDEMPPKGLPRPDAHERDRAVAVLEKAVQRAVAERRSTDGRPVLRRLNRVEYQNTMTDLLAYEMDYNRDIPPEGLSRDGFRNNGSALRMTAVQLEYYLEAARKALARVITTDEKPFEIFEYPFTESTAEEWLLREEDIAEKLVSRTNAFLAWMPTCYPEEGRFEVTVTAGAQLQPGKGPPIMEVSVGFRPDTKILFRTMGVVELTSEEPQTFTFSGFMENYPRPVPGQSKYPGLLVRVTNLYDDGTPAPVMQRRETEDGKTERYWEHEEDYPKVRVDEVVFKGPAYDDWPPEHHRRILFESPLREEDPDAYLREVLRRFLSRAWRRPAEADEVDRYVEFFDSLEDVFPKFEERLRETLAMALVSPNFLYLMEPDSERKRPLDAFELASRLSYFLWSTMPDERLLRLAESGELLGPATLAAEVERMVADERAERFADQFAGDWLYLEAMDRVIADPVYHPNVTDSLLAQFRAEPRKFFLDILRSDSSAENFIDSDFLVINERLARHYGLQDAVPGGVWGSEFRRVPLPADSPRGGLLTQAAVLLGASTGSDSHPIKRAVWVRKRLLDDPPPPPPPNVPELDAESPDSAGKSVRELLAMHRADPACALCHRDIDPWGLAFERFDAIGQWRNQIRRLRPHEEEETADAGADGEEEAESAPPEFDRIPVDARGTLPDGTAIDGVDDLRAYLLGPRREDFARTLVTKMMAYALGRSLELTDEAEVDRITHEFLDEDLRLKNLVQKVVSSDLFHTK